MWVYEMCRILIGGNGMMKCYMVSKLLRCFCNFVILDFYFMVFSGYVKLWIILNIRYIVFYVCFDNYKVKFNVVGGL